jgi:NADPH-dependent 2,4-dienoyl-CoA reductase/sulfur reductase-like enzyme
MIIPEQGVGARVFPADLAAFLVDYYREKGVEMRMGEGMATLDSRGSTVEVRTTSGAMVPAEVAVAGLGIVPDSDVAEQAGLRIDNGVLVDEYLRTSAPDVYAAGDVANFPSHVLGTRTRVEHEDNANTMGDVAGQNMAGAGVRYDHLPFFYSDLFKLGYEAVGDLDARHETVVDWKEPMKEGVIYYLRDGRVRGVLLWNTWEQVDAARALIAEPGPFRAADLKGRLPAAR